jgi:3-hydroxypropionyl-CoA synthetase (ADP-forming)
MATPIINAALNAQRTVLTEPEAKAICKAYSIPTPQGEVAKTQEDAFEISKKLKFPLAAKIVSEQALHKTDVGGVVLNIQSPEEARSAYNRVIDRIKQNSPQAKIDGVLLERMTHPGVEVIIGATQDPQFGKVLMFGMGGVFVEALRDVTFKLAPITEVDASDMVARIRSQKLLNKFRGSAAADKAAIVQILLAVSKLISENDEVIELDLNPVIVHERGAVAVDARFVLSESRHEIRASAHPADSLVKFFKAKSVAVIGASATPGKIGHEVLRSLSQYEYAGKVYPVNLTAETILGLKSYASVLDIPEAIDLAVLTVPARTAPSVIDECGRKGVRNVVIVSGGFKEIGIREYESQTVNAGRKYGIRIIGPNCIGVLDGHSRLDTFFQAHERMLRPKPGSVAFLTQSGTFGTTILEWAAEADIGISKFVSYGNRSDVDEGDLVEFLGEDPETSVIGIYVEGLDNGRKLYERARQVTLRKPIVILKSGKTDLGSKAAKSHTGWLAGSYEVAEAAFNQAGIIIANDIEQLYDIVKALAMQPVPGGSNIVMVTNGAGPCVMAADKIEEYGMQLAPMGDATRSALKNSLPSYCLVSETTVDLTGSATSKDYETALQILAKDSAVHVLMPFFVFQDTPLDEGIVDTTARLLGSGKTIVCCAAGGPYTKKMSKAIEAHGVPVYETAERAVAAVSALLIQAKAAARKQRSD